MGSFWLRQLQGGRSDRNSSPSRDPCVPSAPGAAGPQNLALEAGRGGFGASAVVAAEPVLGQSRCQVLITRSFCSTFQCESLSCREQAAGLEHEQFPWTLLLSRVTSALSASELLCTCIAVSKDLVCEMDGEKVAD